VASFMVEDWKTCLQTMAARAQSADMREVLLGVHESLLAFMDAHKALFADAAASRPFFEAFGQAPFYGNVAICFTLLILPLPYVEVQVAGDCSIHFLRRHVRQLLRGVDIDHFSVHSAAPQIFGPSRSQ